MGNFGSALGAMGGAISRTAGEMLMERDKADLEEQKIRLADSLMAARESMGRKETADYADKAETRRQTFQTGERKAGETFGINRLGVESTLRLAEGDAATARAQTLAQWTADFNLKIDTDPEHIAAETAKAKRNAEIVTPLQAEQIVAANVQADTARYALAISEKRDKLKAAYTAAPEGSDARKAAEKVLRDFDTDGTTLRADDLAVFNTLKEANDKLVPMTSRLRAEQTELTSILKESGESSPAYKEQKIRVDEARADVTRATLYADAAQRRYDEAHGVKGEKPPDTAKEEGARYTDASGQNWVVQNGEPVKGDKDWKPEPKWTDTKKPFLEDRSIPRQSFSGSGGAPRPAAVKGSWGAIRKNLADPLIELDRKFGINR